jgi:hypothetical protein
MSKIGARIKKQKRQSGEIPRRDPEMPWQRKTDILEDRCQTNSERLIQAVSVDTAKKKDVLADLFKSDVKEVYLGREVVESKPSVAEPLTHTYARRLGAMLFLATIVLWFVLDLPNCQSLPHAF